MIIQILIPVLTIIGLWLLGEKKRIAFIVFNVCQVLIIYSVIITKSWGILAMSIIYFIFNIWNYIKWGKKPVPVIPEEPVPVNRTLTENEKYLYSLLPKNSYIYKKLLSGKQVKEKSCDGKTTV